MKNNNSITLSNHYKKLKFDRYSLYYFANDSLARDLSNKINALDLNSTSFENINRIVESLDGLFSIVIEFNKFIFLASDCVASRPLFYKLKDSTLNISDMPRTLISKSFSIDKNSSEFTEFKYSGYVCGNKTLNKTVQQLETAEIICYDKKNNKIYNNRYFLYYPIKSSSISKTNKLKELDQILNNIFKRIINRSEDNQIVVPLSGGLDSRLILAKLHELGYSNLLTFSYGFHNSHEVLKAKSFADRLKVKWVHVDCKRVNMKSIFNSKERLKYFNYSDGLRVVPTMSDYFSIKNLLDKKVINSKSIIINGQSGDFTTGNHIPKEVYEEELTINQITEIIYKKHFSIFVNKIKKNQEKIIKSNIKNAMNYALSQNNNDYNPSSLYEFWEWQERQSKYVVNGQRVYEFFGLKWELPLWEPSFTKFWNNIPNEERFNQKLYKDYLNWYDYKSLFTSDNKEIKSKTFPGALSNIVFIFDQLTKKLFGEKFRALKYLSYFSHYSHVYKYFSFNFFLKNINKIKCPPQARGLIGLLITTWLMENNKNNND